MVRRGKHRKPCPDVHSIPLVILAFFIRGQWMSIPIALFDIVYLIS